MAEATRSDFMVRNVSSVHILGNRELLKMRPMARNDQLAQARRSQLQSLIDTRFGGSKTTFALAIGKSPSQVGHWLKGHRNPNGDTCREVESALNLPTGWLDSTETLVAHNTSYQADIIPSFTWEEMMQMEKLPDHFWLTLDDDAMAPRAPRGKVVRFSAGQKPQWGDAVLIHAADGARHVRVYGQDLEHGWKATAPNGAYATLHGGMDGVLVLAVLTAFEGGWASLTL